MEKENNKGISDQEFEQLLKIYLDNLVSYNRNLRELQSEIKEDHNSLQRKLHDLYSILLKAINSEQ